MQITKHARTRMHQRAITAEKIDMVVQYGTIVQCGYLMLRHDIRDASNQNRNLRKQIERLNGLLVVADGEYLVTAYYADQKKQRSLLSGARR